ncbi:hypothetical protein MAR_ORF053 [Marseillevirus marseillevirus]|uniref:Uncharacterized protein n=1 Tax=Marseillevirus marseillevirus TaxID=694581 RepID=D2XA62_GBMV|nr:hypothetical protein MAR_ORF053 [Marseillevirus marseillevirus]ADB03839.1 hypothetical protein MAR_ORF053 [Marseillevirus marseillevirus]
MSSTGGCPTSCETTCGGSQCKVSRELRGGLSYNRLVSSFHEPKRRKRQHPQIAGNSLEPQLPLLERVAPSVMAWVW